MHPRGLWVRATVRMTGVSKGAILRYAEAYVYTTLAAGGSTPSATLAGKQKVYYFVGNLFNRLAQKGCQDRIAALGRQALQRLTGGPPAELCQKLEELAHSGNEESSARVAQELDRTFRRTQAELLPLREKAG